MSSRLSLDHAERALFLLIVVAQLAVVARVDYLPMNDASSHLATGVIALGLWQGDPFFAEHYVIFPKPLPYWATTLALVPLIPVLGGLAALVTLICAYVVALPASFRLLAGGGAGVPLAASIATLAAFPRSYWLGETNFILGLPLFLIAVALFFRMGGGPRHLLPAFCLVALGIYACHVYAVTALMVALSSAAMLELLRRWRGTQPRPCTLGRRQWMGLAYVVLLFSVGAYYVLFEHGTDHGAGRFTFDLAPPRLLRMGLDLFLLPGGRWTSTRMAVLGALALAYGAALYQGLRDRSEAFPSRLYLLVPGFALVLAAWVGPATLVDARGELKEGQIAERLFVFGAFLLLAGLPIGRDQRTRGILLVAVVLFGISRLTEVAAFHRSYDDSMRRMSTSLLARIPEGSRVLPANEIDDSTRLDSLWERLVNYVPVERHGYSPMIFSVPGQQALRHARWGSAFRAPNVRGVRDEEWGYYDHALVQARDWSDCQVCADGRLAFVVGNGDFRLYRVGRPGVAGSPPPESK